MWRGGDEVTQAFLPVVWQGYWSGGDRQECLSHFWGAVGTDRNVYLTFAVRWGQAGMSISLLRSGGDRQECLSHIWGAAVTGRNIYLTRRFFSGHKKAASIFMMRLLKDNLKVLLTAAWWFPLGTYRTRAQPHGLR